MPGRLHLRAPHVLPIAAALVLAAACGSPRVAAAQLAYHPTLAVGPADGTSGFMAHAGVRAAPTGPLSWAQLRADLTAGRYLGRASNVATGALEVGPRERRASPVRVFGLLGASRADVGGHATSGLMAGAGARYRVGRMWLSAEQRFQGGFSPFLVGVSF